MHSSLSRALCAMTGKQVKLMGMTLFVTVDVLHTPLAGKGKDDD